MKQQILKYVVAPLRKNGRLERVLGITRMGSANGELMHQAAFPHATYAPWWSDADFMAIYGEVKANTYVDIYRLYELWSLVGQVRNVPGDILEVGVWRGGSGCIMGRRAQLLGLDDVTIHLCDTFQGVVKAGERDTAYRGGEHDDTSMELVSDLVQNTGVGIVELHKGIFPEETSHEIESTAFRLVHIDVDVYDSARDVFSWSWGRLKSGGVVVFDDYGFYECAGVTRLVNELAEREDLFFIHNLNGHAIFVKK